METRCLLVVREELGTPSLISTIMPNAPTLAASALIAFYVFYGVRGALGDEPDVGLASPPSVAHDDAPAVASALLARFRAVADDRVEELVTAQV